MLPMTRAMAVRRGDYMGNKELADAYDNAIQHFWVAQPSNHSVDDKIDSRTHMAIGLRTLTTRHRWREPRRFH